MNILKISVFLILAMLITVSCSEFDELNTNTDVPTKVTSSMLATTLIINTSEECRRGFIMNFQRGKYLVQVFDYGENYNEPLDADYEYYDNLILVEKMVEFATEEGLKNSYQALGHFVRSYVFFEQTMRVGDIPYSEAIRAESDAIIAPKYDTQKDVMIGILDELDEADRLFQIGDDFDGDFIYNGSVTQWRKMVNSFQLFVLMQLQLKEDDAALNVKGRFADIINNRPIFESNSDNFSRVFNESNRYPWLDYTPAIIYTGLSSYFVERLKDFEDNRLFYYATPSPVQLANDPDLTDSDFAAYTGLNVLAPIYEIQAEKAEGDYSDINKRYISAPYTGEPIYRLSYSDVCFIKAEAAARGWIDGDGEEYYNEGIRSHMKLIAANTADNPEYHHNMPLDEDYISDYLASPQVAYGSSLDARIQQIMTQQHFTCYLQNWLTGYYNYRRTGYPDLPINPEVSLNTNQPDKIPPRFWYSNEEKSYNLDNLKEALDRQYSGIDDENGLMWILK